MEPYYIVKPVKVVFMLEMKWAFILIDLFPCSTKNLFCSVAANFLISSQYMKLHWNIRRMHLIHIHSKMIFDFFILYALYFIRIPIYSDNKKGLYLQKQGGTKAWNFARIIIQHIYHRRTYFRIILQFLHKRLYRGINHF